jgi:acetoin utilization deacetylase AcuC-like enzyme
MTEPIYCAILQSIEHQLAGHPERPERLSGFVERDLFAGYEWLTALDPLEPSQELLLQVHHHGYLSALERAQMSAPGLLDGGDTYFAEGSLAAARRSLGGALAATQATLERPGSTGFSLSRPPGHHATANQALGFCLLNNVAVACRYAQSNGIKRVLVIDFDVHHGNGTQDIFEEDPDIFYLSTHQRGIFPGTGHLEEVGRNHGHGTVFNVPLPAFTSGEGYLDLFQEILPPILGRAAPELILVSAGYDAHWADPLANLQLDEHTFYRLGRLLQSAAAEHAGGRLAFVLEGGYNPEALYNSVLATWHGLQGHPLPEELESGSVRPAPDLSDLRERFLRVHFPES